MKKIVKISIFGNNLRKLHYLTKNSNYPTKEFYFVIPIMISIKNNLMRNLHQCMLGKINMRYYS